jgi:putative redox protein
MKAQVDCNWTGGMSFETEMDGHKIVLDAKPEVGGKDLGPRPKPFMLLALAGCTGMDVISILNKMGQEVSWFNVRVESEMTEEHPKHYSGFHIIYEFKASDDLNRKKVDKAIVLSQDKYCGVSEVLKQASPVTHQVDYL